MYNMETNLSVINCFDYYNLLKGKHFNVIFTES